MKNEKRIPIAMRGLRVNSVFNNKKQDVYATQKVKKKIIM